MGKGLKHINRRKLPGRYKVPIIPRSESEQVEKVPVNNVEGLQAALKAIQWPRDTPWIERLDHVGTTPIPEVDLNADVLREEAFVDDAMRTVRKAYEALVKLEIGQISRPDDYYAEMVSVNE
jgi:hypothetical protein